MKVTTENCREVSTAQEAARRKAACRKARQELQCAAVAISWGCERFLMEKIEEDPGPMLAALTVAADLLQELEDTGSVS